jgi:23S rRNA (guanosine2251-2'-O)-methyltransferase
MKDNQPAGMEIIGGVNPVREALRAQSRKIHRLYMAQGRTGKALAEILQEARANNVPIRQVEKKRLDKMYGGSGHQGVVAEVGSFAFLDLADIIDSVTQQRALVLVLDGVEDPMNLGALIRSAEAAGANGLVLPRERAAPLTSTALKASAGAAEYVPVARVTNLVRALNDLKDAGFFVIGAAADADHSLYDQDLNLRLALVIGGEGRGLRRLVRETCDVVVSIPLAGRIESLNASVAGAVAMFEYVRQGRGQ